MRRGGAEAVPPLGEVAQAAYAELRALAAAHMRGERGSHTLQPTALVNEVWVRLAQGGPKVFASRAGFIRYASMAMRNLLVDHARRRSAQRRGGGQTVRLGDTEPADGPGLSEDEILGLHEALELLASSHPRAASVVEMRFFGGATTPEVAEALGIARRTVEKDWAAARVWLQGKLGDGGPQSGL